jgi:hypothetical protein
MDSIRGSRVSALKKMEPLLLVKVVAEELILMAEKELLVLTIGYLGKQECLLTLMMAISKCVVKSQILIN